MNALKLVTSLIMLISDIKLRRLLKQAVALLVEELHKPALDGIEETRVRLDNDLLNDLRKQVEELRKQPATCNGIDQQKLIDENNRLRQQVEELAGHKARQLQLFQENNTFKKYLVAKDQQIADLTKSAEEVDASNRLDVDRLMKALNDSTEKLATLQQQYDDVSKAHASMMETELKLRNRITELTKAPKTDSQIRSWALEQIARTCLVMYGRQADSEMSTDVSLLTGKLVCSTLDGRASDACCSADLPFMKMACTHDDLYDILHSRLYDTSRGITLRNLRDRIKP